MPIRFPHEELLDPDGLKKLQRQKLADMLATVLSSNPFYRNKLAGIQFNPRTDPIDTLPFTTRAELQQDQIENPPFGTNLTRPIEKYTRLHQTSGTTGTPLRWLDHPDDWQWWIKCWAIIYAAAGLTQSDRLMVPASFGPFIGFWGAFDCSVAMGMLTLPAGGMTTTARLRYLIENQVTAVCCTPTYALRMAEVAERERINLKDAPVRALIVAGEPGGSIPATRALIESAWNARIFDHWGMTEIGPLGFECAESPGTVHLTESECIPEVIDPHTARPVPDGQSGELVLTNLGRTGSPLIRYRTGDRVRISRRHCACGRSFAAMEQGIQGRIDDMMIIHGVNVFPAAIEDILRRFPQVAEFRMQPIRKNARTDLRVEVELVELVEPVEPVEPTDSADRQDLDRKIADAVRDRLHFRPNVVLVDPGTLPRFKTKARRLMPTREDETSTQ